MYYIIKVGASKHALLAYSDSLRAELFAHPNINVITVQPGYIDVKRVSKVLANSGLETSDDSSNHPHGFRPDHVAARILVAIVDGEHEVLVATLLQRVAIGLRFFLPNFFFSLMRARAEKSLANNFR